MPEDAGSGAEPACLVQFDVAVEATDAGYFAHQVGRGERAAAYELKQLFGLAAEQRVELALELRDPPGPHRAAILVRVANRENDRHSKGWRVYGAQQALALAISGK